MSARVLHLLVWAALVLSVVTDSKAQQAHKRYWEETKTETLWRGRYSNEDYGFYVSLSKGVVGHGNHSPSPNHGIYVSLPDVGNVNPAYDADRSVWVDAHYNTSDYRSLGSVMKYEIGTPIKGANSRLVLSIRSRQPSVAYVQLRSPLSMTVRMVAW